jgi:hypothetical protein
VEIVAEAVLIPEKEYINGIAVAVWGKISIAYSGKRLSVISPRQGLRIWPLDSQGFWKAFLTQ